MKLSQLILALSVSISGAAFAADNHGHDLKPMHGGAVAEAKEVEYEFVASADKLQLYMRDHGKLRYHSLNINQRCCTSDLRPPSNDMPHLGQLPG